MANKIFLVTTVRADATGPHGRHFSSDDMLYTLVAAETPEAAAEVCTDSTVRLVETPREFTAGTLTTGWDGLAILVAP